MSSRERQVGGLRGGALSDRLQVIALLALTSVTAVLAVIVLLGLFDDDASPAANDSGSQAITADREDAARTDDSASDGSDTDTAAQASPRVVFIGDEWAGGAGATGADKAFPAVAAADLGWTIDIDAVPGSGWTKDSPAVPNSRFVDRAARLTAGDNAPDVVVFSAQTPSGSPLQEVADLIGESVDQVRAVVPDAITVVVLPVANDQADFLCPPVAEDLICIDTFGEAWLTPGDRRGLMNNDANAPNNAGHARLARFLADDLRAALPGLAS